MNIGSPPARDYSLDNVRFLLIFSVVFAHLLEVCAPFEGIWKIYKFIYSFHMPLFLFLFGYHARYLPKRIVYRWCIPYVIFQCVYILFSNRFLGADAEIQFTTPYWLLWYLLAGIYYLLLLPMFDVADRRQQILATVCVFVISFLVGTQDSVGYFMSMSRFFVFQPWFVMGYYCKKNNVLDRIAGHTKLRIFALLASAAVMIFLVSHLWDIPKSLFYGSYSFAKCKGTPWMRGIAWAMSFSVILFLLVGVKPYLNKKLPLITHIGQNTWPVFLLHGFVVKAAPVHFEDFVSSPWRVLLLSCAILLLAGNKFCNKAIYYTCFSWLEKIPEKAERKETGR